MDRAHDLPCRRARGEAKLCPNCGSDKHIECCARCGALIKKRRRGTQFCSDRCEREQQEADALSAELERAEQDSKVTVYTITDDQIRWLQRHTGWEGDQACRDQHVIAQALSTPDWIGYDANARELARVRCADWYNERMAEIPNIFDDLDAEKKP